MKYIKNIILIVLIFVILEYFQIIDFKQLFDINSTSWIEILIPCTFILLAINIVTGIRWALISRIYGFNIEMTEAIYATCKAGLFTYFLPGQLGNEIGRVAIVSKNKSTFQINMAISASIADRVFALQSQLFLTFCFVFFLFYSSITKEIMFIGIVIVFCALCMGVLAYISTRGLILRFKYYKYIDYLGNLLKIFKNLFGNNPKFCLYIFTMSLILNLSVSMIIYFIVKSLFFNINFSTVTLMSLLSNISSIIPLTPGGLGISEFIFKETAGLVTGKSLNIAGAYIIFRVLNIFSFATGVVLIDITNLYKKAI